MVRLGLKTFRRRIALAPRHPATLETEHLGRILPEGVAAILLPHLKTAVRSYAERDHGRLLAAYAAGAMLLADLLSQNKGIRDWRSAGDRALRRLAERVDVDAFRDPAAHRRACLAADVLVQELIETREHRPICQMLDSAIADMSDPRTASRGAVALRAAMARLEAAALRLAPRQPLAA